MSPEDPNTKSTYRDTGVDQEAADAAIGGFAGAIRSTFGLNRDASVLLDLGFFANVVQIGPGPCIAVSTDSAGTKVLIAEMMGRHDTIGIDCVAMNVNDVICVGAEPVCFLDYIAITEADPEILDALVAGVVRGAELSECSVPGGEIAQVRDILTGSGDGPHYDLVGTAVGKVDKDAIITGKEVQEGDVVLGLASTGLHSNGYSLARSVLFGKMGLGIGDPLPEAGRTVGEELLEPTAIYVREVKRMLRANLAVRGLANITGGGFTNLLRLHCEGIGFVLDDLPDPLPVFQVLQKAGDIPLEEMYEVFNMGVGFCIVLPAEDADRAIEICRDLGTHAQVLGRAVRDPDRKLLLPAPGLEGLGGSFRRVG